MSIICLRREYGSDQEDGSLATVANVRYLGFLTCVDFAYFCYFSILLGRAVLHIVKCLSIWVKNKVRRKKNCSIMKC